MDHSDQEPVLNNWLQFLESAGLMTDTEQVNFLFNGDSRYEEERFMELGDALQRLFDQDPDRLFDVTNWDFFEKTGFTTDHLYHLEGQLLSSMWAHKQKHLNPMFVLR